MTAYEEYRRLPFDASYYGLPHCIVSLGLEEPIYKLFDFTYPPLIMETTMDQTNYAFMTIKYQFMHDIVPCIQRLNISEVKKGRDKLLRYDQYHLRFTDYLREGVRHHYDVYQQPYPLFKHYFKIHIDHLQKMSDLYIEYRHIVPFGNLWKEKFRFYIEQWVSYWRRWYS